MGRKWAYSEMTKEAKKFGGPEEYVEAIQEEAFQEGRESRDKDVNSAYVKGGIIAAAVSGLIAWGWRKRQQRKEERIKMAQKAKEAEVKLIEELKKETEEETGENEES